MPSSDQDSLPLRWEIPSFDPPKPPKPPKNPPIQYPTVEEVEAIRANAYHEAYELGSNQGFIEGRESGYKEGQQKGYEEGYQKGYLDAHTETNRLHDALKELLLTLDGLPQAISEPLTQLAFEIGIRLSANESMERGPFVAAVQEALMRLPRPGRVCICGFALTKWRPGKKLWKTQVCHLRVPFWLMRMSKQVMHMWK